ncbi:MAG: NmrA family NAD(P)-binding protein [Chitinophagaceae bacterium]
MKYVITGSTGHISKPIITALVKAGHEVTVITSKADREKEIASLGATAAVGAVEDVVFLTKAFSGAKAVYTMVPPTYTPSDWKAHIGQVGKNYAEAIKSNGIKYVVNLSSVGAHMAEGCGPVSGLHRVETALNGLTGVHIKHLRPAYFYYNLLNNINLIKNAGIIGSNFGMSDKKFTLADPSDIAAAAITHLLNLDFTGQSVQYVISDEVSTDEIATVLGNAINKPELKWITFTDEQALQGALEAGLPEELAKNYTEMGHAVQTGEMGADYWKNHVPVAGKVKLADFAKTFAAAYNGEATVAAH